MNVYAVTKKGCFVKILNRDIKMGLNTFNTEEKSYPVYPLILNLSIQTKKIMVKLLKSSKTQYKM